MSDFFNTLVERALPSTTLVMPRRPALFESPAAVLPPAPEPAPAVGESPKVERREPIMAPAPAQPAIIAPPVTAPIVAHDEPHRRTIEPSPPPTVVLTATVQRPAPIVERVQPPAVAPLVVDMPRAPETRVIRPPEEERSERREVQPARRVPVATARAPREGVEPSFREPLRPSIIVPAVQRAPIARKETDEAPRVRERGDPPPVAAPRIEVTIGTVEVRALVAASAPAQTVIRAPREPAPPVSLNDYLKQRGGARP